MGNTLSLGDKVLWSGAWGTEPQKEVKVIGIIKCYENGLKDGDEISSVEWDNLTDRNYLLDLDNNHWCWVFQVEQIS